MGSCVPTLFWFDRFDDRVGVLPVAGELAHTEVVCGEDYIEFASEEVPEKGDRIVWRDVDGTWREHVVVSTDEPLTGPCEVHAESSLCEMLGDYLYEVHVTSADAATALAAALAPTRWEAGDVDEAIETQAGCIFYHTNALAALRRVEELWGCEAVPALELGDGRVAARRIDLLAQQGESRGVRLSYRKNMAGCTRRVLDDEVCTALYGFGAGLAVTDEDGAWTGGYTRKLTFADVNDGVAWVGDEDARLLWGRWDAERGELVHRFGDVTFSDCEDAEELLELTRAELAERCEPKVSFEVDVAALDGGECGLGDVVVVVDSSRSPEWRLEARVTRRVRTFGDAVVSRVTVGEVEEADYMAAAETASEVATLSEDVAGVSAVVASVAEAVEDLDLSEVEF